VLAVVLSACAAPVIDSGGAVAPQSTSPAAEAEGATDGGGVVGDTTTTIESPTTTVATTTTTAPEDDVIPKTPPERVPPTSPEPPPQRGSGGEVPDDYLAAVLADAAERTGVAVEELDVVEAAAVVWSDGSLGCPQPGREYIQVLIDGYRVVVSAAGTTLDYRLDGRGNFFVCDAPKAPPES